MISTSLSIFFKQTLHFIFPLDFHGDFVLLCLQLHKLSKKMTERPIFSKVVDTLFGRRQSFRLYPTSTRVEDLDQSRNYTHISPIPLRPGDKRRINNLELSVLKTPDGFSTTEFKIRETRNSVNGLKNLSLNEFSVKNGIVRIGSDVIILYRGESRAGRRKIVIARPDGIDVHSQQHRQRKQRKLAAELAPCSS